MLLNAFLAFLNVTRETRFILSSIVMAWHGHWTLWPWVCFLSPPAEGSVSDSSAQPSSAPGSINNSTWASIPLSSFLFFLFFRLFLHNFLSPLFCSSPSQPPSRLQTPAISEETKKKEGKKRLYTSTLKGKKKTIQHHRFPHRTISSREWFSFLCGLQLQQVLAATLGLLLSCSVELEVAPVPPVRAAAARFSLFGRWDGRRRMSGGGGVSVPCFKVDFYPLLLVILLASAGFSFAAAMPWFGPPVWGPLVRPDYVDNHP